MTAHHCVLPRPRARDDKLQCPECGKPATRIRRPFAHCVNGWVLYRCYDFTGTLVYIGKSGNLRARIRTHEREDRKRPRSEQWWYSVEYMLIQRYGSPVTLHRAEQYAIATEHPVFNQVGRRPRQ